MVIPLDLSVSLFCLRKLSIYPALRNESIWISGIAAPAIPFIEP
jgi:hypothetical protein